MEVMNEQICAIFEEKGIKCVIHIRGNHLVIFNS